MKSIQKWFISKKQRNSDSNSIPSKNDRKDSLRSNILVDNFAEESGIYNSIESKKSSADHLGLFSLLTKDNLSVLFSFLNESNLFTLGQTCCSMYSTINNYSKFLNLVIPNRTNEELSLNSNEGWTMFVGSQLENKIRKNTTKLPNNDVMELQKLFDPNIDRKAAVVTARVFPLPKNMYNCRNCNSEEFVDNVVKYLENKTMKVLHDGEKFDTWDTDAWESWRSNGEVHLQTFERISNIETFNQILQGQRKKHQGSISSSAEILSTLARILKTKEMMLYWDPDFKAVEMGGMRYLILGEENGCLFQWETYSNFCGGPYAGYSCGMG